MGAGPSHAGVGGCAGGGRGGADSKLQESPRGKLLEAGTKKCLFGRSECILVVLEKLLWPHLLRFSIFASHSVHCAPGFRVTPVVGVL